MDEPAGYYIKWNKAEGKRQIPYDFTHMRNSKKQNKRNKNSESISVVSKGEEVWGADKKVEGVELCGDEWQIDFWRWLLCVIQMMNYHVVYLKCMLIKKLLIYLLAEGMYVW